MAGAEIRQTDIVFECPSCGKSLAVDEKGAGLVITCPDCGAQVVVPDREPTQEELDTASFQNPEQIQMLVESLGNSQQKIRELTDQLDVSEKKRHRLESTRETTNQRFERIREDVASIQAALDRIVDTLQDYSAPEE